MKNVIQINERNVPINFNVQNVMKIIHQITQGKVALNVKVKDGDKAVCLTCLDGNPKEGENCDPCHESCSTCYT